MLADSAVTSRSISGERIRLSYGVAPAAVLDDRSQGLTGVVIVPAAVGKFSNQAVQVKTR